MIDDNKPEFNIFIQSTEYTDVFKYSSNPLNLNDCIRELKTLWLEYAKGTLDIYGDSEVPPFDPELYRQFRLSITCYHNTYSNTASERYDYGFGWRVGGFYKYPFFFHEGYGISEYECSLLDRLQQWAHAQKAKLEEL